MDWHTLKLGIRNDGIYIGLVITNFDTISRHLPAGFQIPVFWFAAGVGSRRNRHSVLWGFSQPALNVEDRMWAVLLPEITKAGNDPAMFLGS